MYRIAYDAKRLFNNFTGLGNYSRTLVRNLSDFYPDHDYYLYSPKYKRNSETSFFLSSPAFVVRTPKSKWPLLWRTSGVKKMLKKDKVDIYHGLSHEIPVGLHRTDIPSIVTIHDLIFKYYPEQYGLTDRLIYDWKFKYACQKSDRVLAISESTKADIVKLYGVKPEKIQVIYQSCNPRFFSGISSDRLASIRVKYNLPETYMFYVGSLIERKNLLGIVEAIAVQKKEDRMPLVIVGRGSLEYEKRVRQKAQQAGILDLLIFIQPEYADLPALYQLAYIFIYPSYYEGFGIPIIEALFSQVPVITSKLSSMPEAAGKAACLVHPGDKEEMSAAIQRVASDSRLREELVEAGKEQVQKFDGRLLTDQLMKLYQEVLG